MKKFEYSIIIPTYNHLAHTIECVTSVIANTDMTDSEIIVVDNGSTDGTIEWLMATQKSFKNFSFLSFSDALGGGNAFNMGFKVARGDYFVALNNDTKILAPNWIPILREPFDRNEVGSKPPAITGPVKHYSGETNAPFIVLFCAMIPRKVMYSVGLLMDMGPGYGEDIDWCRRAIDKGYSIVQVLDCKSDGTMMVGQFPIYHAGEVTVHDIPNWREITENNRKILMEKWK